jgi:hypothetical protein
MKNNNIKSSKEIIEKLRSNQLYREALRIAPPDEKDKISNVAEDFVLQFFSIINITNQKIEEENLKQDNKNNDDIVKEEENSDK